MRATACLLLPALFLCACGSDTPATSAGDGTQYVAPAAEHRVSPLAQLMRDMTAFADTARERIAAGRELPPYPAHFKDMLTAEPTPGMVDHRTYDPFAFAYLFQLDSLYKAAPADRAEVFNAVVAGCANCHGEVCPGPLVRINKLYAR